MDGTTSALQWYRLVRYNGTALSDTMVPLTPL